MKDSIKNIKVDMVEVRADIARNKQERLEFLDQYADWLKKTPNKVWSKQQNVILGKK